MKRGMETALFRVICEESSCKWKLKRKIKAELMEELNLIIQKQNELFDTSNFLLINQVSFDAESGELELITDEIPSGFVKLSSILPIKNIKGLEDIVKSIGYNLILLEEVGIKFILDAEHILINPNTLEVIFCLPAVILGLQSEETVVGSFKKLLYHIVEGKEAPEDGKLQLSLFPGLSEILQKESIDNVNDLLWELENFFSGDSNVYEQTLKEEAPQKAKKKTAIKVEKRKFKKTVYKVDEFSMFDFIVYSYIAIFIIMIIIHYQELKLNHHYGDLTMSIIFVAITSAFILGVWIFIWFLFLRHIYKLFFPDRIGTRSEIFLVLITLSIVVFSVLVIKLSNKEANYSYKSSRELEIGYNSMIEVFELEDKWDYSIVKTDNVVLGKKINKSDTLYWLCDIYRGNFMTLPKGMKVNDILYDKSKRKIIASIYDVKNKECALYYVSLVEDTIYKFLTLPPGINITSVVKFKEAEDYLFIGGKVEKWNKGYFAYVKDDKIEHKEILDYPVNYIFKDVLYVSDSENLIILVLVHYGNYLKAFELSLYTEESYDNNYYEEDESFVEVDTVYEIDPGLEDVASSGSHYKNDIGSFQTYTTEGIDVNEYIHMTISVDVIVGIDRNRIDFLSYNLSEGTLYFYNINTFEIPEGMELVAFNDRDNTYIFKSSDKYYLGIVFGNDNLVYDEIDFITYGEWEVLYPFSRDGLVGIHRDGDRRVLKYIGIYSYY